MMDINSLLTIPYQDYGRTMRGADCWGLVRLVRNQLRGDWLPAFGSVCPDDKRQITQSAATLFAPMREQANPQPGALAAVWRGRLCLHMGIVIRADGLLAVLETNRATGVRWMRIADYNAMHQRVTYHDTY